MKHLISCLGLGLLCVTFAVAAIKLPPVPPKPHVVLRSPKDTANQAQVIVYIPLVIVPLSKKIVWENKNTNKVAFVVEHKTNLINKWEVLGQVTNVCEWPIMLTNKYEFFRVGAYNLGLSLAL